MTESDHVRWFEAFRTSPDRERLRARPIAYFCAEFALENAIPTFAGGLGVLAGDVLREAADRGLPMVAVGLYYRQGYACPVVISNGERVETCQDTPPETVGLAPVLDEAGEPLRVRVPIQNRWVVARAWKWTRGGVDAYLLDTDVEPNAAADRGITRRLYVSDAETRFKQEIVLGIGGLRLLEALHIHPSVYHLNEGHSALLGFEIIHHEMQERSLGFEEAKTFARRRIAFTNHTLLPAGEEIYADDLASLLLAGYAQEISVPLGTLLALGLVADSSSFSMTMLALRLSGTINAVSKLHAKKAKETWHDHPMVPITNGVHLPTWDRVATDVRSPGSFWPVHQRRKMEWLARIRDETGRQWEPDALLLGWARRIASYKRPLSALEDARRFAAIARHARRPVRLVFAGRPHPADQEGVALLERLRALVDGELKDVAAYLPAYDLNVAASMVSGCDVWLNTPVVGFEACGTSGMKAALNGVLPCSTKDGWVDEAEIGRVGWLLADARLTQDLLDRVENSIAPLYYERGAGGVPAAWEERMRRARAMVEHKFSATRLLRGYAETLYL